MGLFIRDAFFFFFAEVSCRVRCGAPQVTSLRKFRVNLLSYIERLLTLLPQRKEDELYTADHTVQIRKTCITIYGGP